MLLAHLSNRNLTRGEAFLIPSLGYFFFYPSRFYQIFSTVQISFHKYVSPKAPTAFRD